MVSTFFEPTRVVAGQGALATVGTVARDLGIRPVLVVSDPMIACPPARKMASAEADEMSERYLA